jgi:chromosome segregation ATPase
MFIEDGSLQYIEADAQDVIAMYRSTSTVMIAHGGRDKQPCEAFVCVVQDGAFSTAYVALSMQKSRSFVIFTPQNKPTDRDSSDTVVREALEFVKKHGFEMQSVNLNYSKALKEVVLNDLRVVRSAVVAKKASQKKVAGDKTSKVLSLTPDAAGNAAPVDGEKTLEHEPQKGKESDVKDTLKRSGSPHDADSERMQNAQADISGQSGGRSKAEKAVSVSAGESVVAAARIEKERLQNEKKRVVVEAEDELAALQAEIATLVKEIKTLTAANHSKIVSARAELEHLSASKTSEQSASTMELASLAETIEEMRKEVKAYEDNASQQLCDARAEIARLSAEKLALEQRTASELSEHRMELKRLMEEKEAAQKEKDREIATLRHDLELLSSTEGTDEDLVQLKAQVERLASEKTDAQKARVAELSSLSEEIASLEAEKRHTEEEGEQELSMLRSELARLKSGKTTADEVMGAELINLRAELDHLRGEKDAAEKAASSELSTLRSEKEHLIKENARFEEEMTGEIGRLRAELALLEEEKISAEATFSGVLSELKSDVARLTTEKEMMERAFAEEQAALKNTIRVLEEDIAAFCELSTNNQTELRREIDLLSTRKLQDVEAAAAEASALNAELERLQEESSAAREKSGNAIEAMKVEITRLSSDMAAEQEKTSAELIVLRDEATRLAQERASAEAVAGEELEAARSVVSRLAAEVVELEEGNAEMIAELCSEAERLLQEREAAEQKAVSSVAQAREKVERLASELLHTGNAIMEMISATHSAILGGWVGLPADELSIESFANELKSKSSVQDVISRVAKEKAVVEETVELETLDLWEETTLPEDEKTGIEELSGESEKYSPVADTKETCGAKNEEAVAPVEVALPSAEIDNQSGGKAEMEVEERKNKSGRHEVAVTPSVETVTAVGQHDDLEDSAICLEPNSTDPFAFLNSGETQLGIGAGFTDTSKGSSGPPVQFIIDRSLKAVEYRTPNDIVEIYQSLNRTRVSMEDNTTVTCDAYLCGVVRDGRNHVYIALNLVDTKGALVYVPEVQPEDADSYAKILRDGMDFVEIVGFMMDGVDLGGSEAKRVKALDKIPVLCKVSG